MALNVDNFTLILLATFASLLLYHRFFSRSTALVHPLLLGKQSDVSSVRRPGETGVYRSWATGQGSPLTVRPANSLKTVQDIIQETKGPSATLPRCILDVTLTDESLSEIIHLLPLGLASLFPNLSSSPTSPTPILTLLPPSPSTSFPLLLLSLSLPPSTPLLVIPSPTLLTAALTSSNHPRPGVVVVHASLVDDVVEQMWEDCGSSAGVLIVGDPDGAKVGALGRHTVDDARKKGMVVRYWEEIWEAGEKGQDGKKGVPDSHFNDVHSYFYSEGKGPEAKPIVVKSTHLNVTAGIAALLSLFPADKRPSAALRDVVASAVRLDTPIGMTIALASVWSGAGFRMIGNPNPTWETKEEDEERQLEILGDSSKGPKPTILFLTSTHHTALLSRLQETFLKHPLSLFAARHKVPSLMAGEVSRNGLMEKYVWSGVRERVLGGLAGDKLRGVIIVGDAPPPETLGLSHILLSLPTTRLHASPLSAGPVFVSHFYDVQTSSVPDVTRALHITSSGEKTHVGPPATNVEVVLKGPGVELGDGSAPLRGRVWIRGPGVLERVDGRGTVIEGWTDIEEEASVKTNGTFVIESNV